MTSFLERMKAKMTGSLSKVADIIKPAERTRDIIRTNRFDERVWIEARKTKPVDDLIRDLSLGDEHKGGERPEFEAASDLGKALWLSLYKAAPHLESKRGLERDVYAAHKIIQEMLDNPKLQELQDMTAGDPTMSTIAFSAMGEAVRQIVARIPPPPPPPMPKPPQQEKQDGPGQPQQPGGDQPGQADGENPAGTGQGPAAPGGDEGGQEPAQEPASGSGSELDEDEDLTEDADTEDFDPDSEDAENQAETEWENAFDEALDGLDIERAMNKALDAAAEEAEDLENLRKGIGLGDGDWQSMSPEQRLAMAEKLRTPEMKELSEAIGRMKRFALGVKASRVIDVPHEAFDVETGDDLRRLLKSEFALLGTKETTYEFYRRYADKELLQFKMRGHEEVGKGPIVICIDKSGSMSGGPFTWAMAVAEALRRFASDEDRDYYAMFFGSNNDRNRFDFPKGKAPFEKVLSFLGTEANGGTQFDGVLTEALEKASKSFDGEGKGKADIVFVTDGQANLTPEWIKQFNTERERVGVRVFSVYIGGAYDMGGRGGPLGLLEEFSDAVINVKDLKPESVKEVFAHV